MNMMVRNPSGGGGKDADAVIDGIYKTQATDLLMSVDPEIEIEFEIDVEEEGAEGLQNLEPLEDAHDANLLETIFAKPEDEPCHPRLKGLASELCTQIDEDLRSRSAWEDTYKKGLELLGLQFEERSEPWDGACGVFHPLLTEAVVRFQSEAITETFPATGPVKTQIIGKQTPERMLASERVKDDMNWRLTDEMPEYRVEHERMLWNLPIAGSAFKKVYFDETYGRQVSMFLPAEDVIVNYGASDLRTAERVTHRMKRSDEWLRKMVDAGVYCDYTANAPTGDTDELQDAKDKLTGSDGSNAQNFTVYEAQVSLTIEEDEDFVGPGRPYVVTLLKDSSELLSIRRNWKKDDARCCKRDHMVHYQYVVGFGFYGFGLIHLVGGHAKTSTSLLRQLVDAGTLSNVPAGYKTKGLRIRGDDKPIKPGEFRDVDVLSGALKDNIMPLPFKEPSAVLAGLLATIVEDGRKAAAISDTTFADANQNAPVGTTLALIERQLKTLSAVQARIHATMRQEFKLLKELVRTNGERAYPYDADPDKNAKDGDYAIIEILPVSDPNATTMGVRIAQYQAVLQLAEKSPQLYDLAYLHREMLSVLGVKNAQKIVPMPADQKPRDPVSENMAVLMGKPVKAFVIQDHEAHIMCHQAFLNDPKIGMLLGQNPGAQVMFNSMQAHIAEHAAYAYRKQVQDALGIELPDPNDEIDPQMEYDLASMLAMAATAVLTKNKNEQAQAQAQQAAQDPVLQLQQQELAIKGKETDAKVVKMLAEADKIRAETGNGAGMEAQKAIMDMQMKARESEQEQQRKEKAFVMEQSRKERATAMELQRKARMAQIEAARSMRDAALDSSLKQRTHQETLAMQRQANDAKVEATKKLAAAKPKPAAKKTGGS